MADGLTIDRHHIVLSDMFGEYYNGTLQNSPVWVYELNQRGLKNLPRVQNEIWNVCQSIHILRPLAILQLENTVVVYPPMLCTLQEYLRRVRAHLPVPRLYNTVETAHEIATGMNEFQTSGPNGLLHRNLSSETVFVSPEGRFLIGGLFASRAYNEVITQDITRNLWVAPEILSGARNYDFAVDVYAFGIILTELDTLRLPYHDQPAPFLNNLNQYVVNEDMRPSLSKNCPVWYEDLVDLCYSGEHAQRPSFEIIVQVLANPPAYRRILGLDIAE